MKKDKFNIKSFIKLLVISLVIMIISLGSYYFLSVPRTLEKLVVKPLTIVKSYDKKKVFYFDDKFKMAEKGSLNKQASLEMINAEEELFFVYLQHVKKDYTDYNAFIKKLKDANKKLYGEGEAKALVIGDAAGEVISYRHEKDTLVISLKVFVFEDAGVYNEIMLWGEQDNEELIEDYLKNLKIYNL